MGQVAGSTPASNISHKKRKGPLPHGQGRRRQRARGGPHPGGAAGDPCCLQVTARQGHGLQPDPFGEVQVSLRRPHPRTRPAGRPPCPGVRQRPRARGGRVDRIHGRLAYSHRRRPWSGAVDHRSAAPVPADRPSCPRCEASIDPRKLSGRWCTDRCSVACSGRCVTW